MAGGILLLAAFTGRSQAYAQMIARTSIPLECVVTFGNEDGTLSGQVKAAGSLAVDADDQPDLTIPLSRTIAHTGWQHEHCDASNVNDYRVVALVENNKPSVIVYSGYGSQIVGGQLLGLGVPIIHVHSGYLPQFRGSTTIYYSILEENNIGVSCIILSAGIDTGGIIARRKLPMPIHGSEIDYTYDTMIRANLLCEVLSSYVKIGEIEVVVEQQIDEGEDYYIIHPILKHIANLIVERSTDNDAH